MSVSLHATLQVTGLRPIFPTISMLISNQSMLRLSRVAPNLATRPRMFRNTPRCYLVQSSTRGKLPAKHASYSSREVQNSNRACIVSRRHSANEEKTARLAWHTRNSTKERCRRTGCILRKCWLFVVGNRRRAETDERNVLSLCVHVHVRFMRKINNYLWNNLYFSRDPVTRK